MATIHTVLEQWENVAGNRWVNKFDPAHPGKTTTERVRAGRMFYVSPEERNLLNSDRIVDEQNDPFKNGDFRPIKANAVQEAREEEEAVAEQARQASVPNPNHMSDDELASLFEIRNYPQFKKALSGITSKGILRRILVLSENEDYNATVAMVNLVRELLGEGDRESVGGPDVTEIDQVFRVGGAVEDRGTGFQAFKI